jgi:hypothetical protein
MVNSVAVWVSDERTKRLVDMTQEELILAIESMAQEISELKRERDRWWKAADPAGYEVAKIEVNSW